jgi:hypothetical protein
MAEPVELVPLVCLKCSTPLPAAPEEVAWVCPTCGTGLELDELHGLAQLEVHYSSQITPNTQGKPFWVAQGRLELERNTYSGDKGRDAQRFWSQPQRFFVPAYTCPLETLLELGNRLLIQPPALQEGPPAAFTAVTLARGDVQSLADFIVMSVEAERADKLKEVRFTLNLSDPVLWILP